MNKDIQYLTKLLYLNEDLLSDLEDDDNDDSDFVNYDENIVITFKDKPDALFMNTYNNVGDLFAYNESYNFFYIIKNNKTIDEIRENLNTKYYGKIIGMCVGKGLWLYLDSYYKTYHVFGNEFHKKWAQEKTILWAGIIKTTDDGWHNTTYILNNYKNDLKNTIWELLYYQNIDGLGEHICYIPSINQLKEIYKNNKIIKIKKGFYCSSSQGDYSSNFVYCMDYYSKRTDLSDKNMEHDYLILIHFK